MNNRQSVCEIPIGELVLWSENPRDPISTTASNVQIIERALSDRSGKWALRKLAQSMGDYYDQSELPIVVYHKGIPVVYDGNRRVILGKIKIGEYLLSKDQMFDIPEYPQKLPCCVTDENTAIRSIWRKHADSGTWDQLSRDIFLHRFMNKNKSLFLIIDEALGGIIANNNSLNKRFVKDEVLTERNLALLGIKVDGENILSRSSVEDTKKIFSDVLRAVEDKVITTRKNRKSVLEILSPSVCEIVRSNEEAPHALVVFRNSNGGGDIARPKKNVNRLSPRVKGKQYQIFGGKLSLETGDVSNLYRDICDLFAYYKKNENSLSEKFPMLIRMSLRLLCELISGCRNSSGLQFIEDSFESAKSSLTSDEKTFLSAHSVSKNRIIQLLHIGAHNYTATCSLDQTIAMSLIIGKILEINFSKKA